MIHQFIKRHGYIFLEVAILFVISFIPLFWFKSSHMVVGLDSGYPIDFIGYMHQRFYTWLSSQDTGINIVSWLGQIPLISVLGLIQQLGVGMYNVQKIVFVFWFAAMSLAMYSFVFYLYPKKQYYLLRFISVFVYVFNFYLLSFWIQGEQTTFSAYTLLPIVMLLLIRFFRGGGIINTAVFLNISFLFFNAGGVLGFPLLGSTIGSVIAFIIFVFSTSKKNQWLPMLKRFVGLGFITSVFGIILNAYYLFPFLSLFSKQFTTAVNTTGGYDALVSWATFISKLASFANLSRLQGDINWDNHLNFYGYDFQTNPFLILLSFGFPILAFLAYFFVKEMKEKWIVFLLLIIECFGFFLAGGLHPPFGFIYEFFMKYIPGFIAFRSPYYKFVPMVYLSTAILTGISVYYLIAKIKRKSIAVGLGFFIIFLIVIYHYPYFVKSSFVFESPFTAFVHVPSYVLDFQKEEQARTDDSRTLIVPPVNSFPIFAYSWNYWSIQSPFTGLSNKPFISNDAGLTPPENSLVSLLYEKLREGNINQFKQLAQDLDISRVIVTGDTVSDYSRAPTEDPKIFYTILTKKPFYLVWKSGLWSIYSWEGAKNRKVTSYSSISLHEGNSYDIFSGQTNESLFADKDQLSSYQLQVLPINKRVVAYPCISCSVLKMDDITISPASILPSSRFYPIKLWKEAQTLKNGSDNLGLYLGLSLKRTAEIIPLKDLDAWSLTIDSWKPTNQLLFDYWKKINTGIERQPSYDNFKSVYEYALVEDKDLSNVYTSLPPSPFKEQFGNTILYIKNILVQLENKLQDYRIGKKFVYQVDALEKFSVRFPYNISFGNTAAKFSLNGNSILSTFSNDEFNLDNSKKEAGTLTLDYNNPNLLSKLSSDTFTLPNEKVSCLYSLIANFRWNASYVISSTIKDTTDIDNIYIKKFSNLTDQQSFLTASEKNLIPDQTISTTNGDSQIVLSSVNGNNNTKSIIVLFCANQANDPSKLYVNPAVYAVDPPTVYSLSDEKLQNKIIPSVTYQRINPTEYKVIVHNAASNFILSFLEHFSNQWKARIIGDKKNISENNHFVLNGYANGWYITKKGNYSIIISFSPQDTFIKATYISISGIILIVFYLVFMQGKKIYGHKK